MTASARGLAVFASGMVASVGFNAAAGLAAMRARLRNVRETNLWDAGTGRYVAAGKVDLPQWWVGLGKLAELAAPAVHECLAAAPVPARSVPILLLVAPPARPHRTPGLDTELLEDIAWRLDLPVHAASAVFPLDRAGLVPALAHAATLLAGGDAKYCVVVGVDSFIDQPTVEHYLARRRILTPDNSNGFSPGEAACAVLVGRDGHPFEHELQILGTGWAVEKATIESDEPLRADGLTEAIASALRDSGLDITSTAYRVTDLNGEHYRFKEMTLAMLRFERQRRPTLFELWHPSEYVGDVGAALGPMILATALHAARKGYAPGPGALCTLSNDGGERGCVVARARRVAP